MPTSARFARRDRLAALVLVVLLVGGAGFLLTRRALLEGDRPPADEARLRRDAVLFDRFSARRERSDDGDHLIVSLRLRTSASVSLPCFVFVVERDDRATPRRWAIWPPQPPGEAITASGHFHAATPAKGAALVLTDTWERVTATMPHPPGGAGFETVSVYVVDPAGRLLLARPFRI